MPRGPLIISANLAWNLVNFRSGLIRALIACGYRVIAAAPPDPESEAALRALGADFAPVRIDSKGLSPWRDMQTFLDYARLFKRERPAAYLGYTIKPNVYGSLAAQTVGVVTIANVSGLGTAFIRNSILTRIAKTLYALAFRRAATVFFQNEDDAALFLDAGLVRARQRAMVPGSGIDTAYFAPGTDARLHRGHFLLVARLVGDKGVREYVEAARIAKASDAELHFSILGFLDVENRTAISRAEVDGWVAEGIITYLSPVNDVRPFMMAADCVVLPSYREGTSRVLLEAAALARPLVATDVPGCREVVVDGETGFLCAARDAVSLASAMMRVAALSDADWQRMGRAGRNRVISTFSEDLVIAEYLAALDRAGVGV